MNAEFSENEQSQTFVPAGVQNGRCDDERKVTSANTEPEQHPQSYLFTLRVWEEALGEGKAEWRGRVQEVASGETLFFRGWPGLIVTLQRLLAKTAANDGDSLPQFLHTQEKNE